MFAAALSGHDGTAPAPEAAGQGFRKITGAVQRDAIGGFLAFNRSGELVRFA